MAKYFKFSNFAQKKRKIVKIRAQATTRTTAVNTSIVVRNFIEHPRRQHTHNMASKSAFGTVLIVRKPADPPSGELSNAPQDLRKRMAFPNLIQF